MVFHNKRHRVHRHDIFFATQKIPQDQLFAHVQSRHHVAHMVAVYFILGERHVRRSCPAKFWSTCATLLLLYRDHNRTGLSEVDMVEKVSHPTSNGTIFTCICFEVF